MRFRAIALCILSILASSARASEPRDFPVDPVALIAGNETPGNDNLSIERGAYRYKFADADNKAAFEKDPQRYEVQLGGACARMGPLNPPGPADHYGVHDGKIYVFASEGCRNLFLANADAYLEKDDPKPELTDDSVRRARELLAQVVDSMGGAKALDAVQRCDAKMYLVAGNDQAYNEVCISFPGSLSWRSKRPNGAWNLTLSGDAAWFDSTERFDRMADSQKHALEREMSRQLIVIVKSRNQPNFVCSHIGKADFHDTEVEQVAVAIRGATSTLMIDPKTGHIVGQSYRGRGTGGVLGDVECVYSDFKTFDGITLPITRQAFFNGDYTAEESGTMDEMHFNAPLDEKMFEMPKDK